MFNLARLFSAYRLLEERIKSLEEDKAQLRGERDEWANKFLAKVQTTPLFYSPPKVDEPKPPPPIGPSGKRAYLASLPQPSVKSDEEILEAARAAQNGNGGR